MIDAQTIVEQIQAAQYLSRVDRARTYLKLLGDISRAGLAVLADSTLDGDGTVVKVAIAHLHLTTSLAEAFK